VLSSNLHNGESISTNLEPADALVNIKWEEWEKRLKPEDYFDQLSRIYPDSFEGTYGIGAKQRAPKPDQHILLCCLCGNPIEDPYGHNAWPLVEDGRCCEKCNQTVVIPERVRRMQERN
jgi:hypothetical protein